MTRSLCRACSYHIPDARSSQYLLSHPRRPLSIMTCVLMALDEEIRSRQRRPILPLVEAQVRFLDLQVRGRGPQPLPFPY